MSDVQGLLAGIPFSEEQLKITGENFAEFISMIESGQISSKSAKQILASLGYNLRIKVADGSLGWQEFAPYDRIIITAAAPFVADPWLKQLKVGGRIVLPIGGSFHQDLTLIKKISQDKTEQIIICGCVFVPLVGEHGWKVE